jgi:hypothetical protein
MLSLFSRQCGTNLEQIFLSFQTVAEISWPLFADSNTNSGWPGGYSPVLLHSGASFSKFSFDRA